MAAVSIAVVIVVVMAVVGAVALSAPRSAAPPRPWTTGARSTAGPTTGPSTGVPSTTTDTPSADPTTGGPTDRAPSSPASPPRPRGTGLYADHPELSINAFYGQSFTTWGCNPVIDPQAPASTAAFLRYSDGLVTCLMNRFAGPVRAVTGRPMSRPSVSLHRGPVSTPCGTNGDRVPFYCSVNQTIYLNPAIITRYDDHVRLGAVAIITHEFAHHVQTEVGILGAAFATDLESPDQISRRLELQAECMTWSQVTLLRKPGFGDRDDREFRSWVSEGQDERHGSAASYRYWYDRIRGQGRMSLCNTWTAPVATVR